MNVTAIEQKPSSPLAIIRQDLASAVQCLFAPQGY
jgi:hypothetical protein